MTPIERKVYIVCTVLLVLLILAVLALVISSMLRLKGSPQMKIAETLATIAACRTAVGLYMADFGAPPVSLRMLVTVRSPNPALQGCAYVVPSVIVDAWSTPLQYQVAGRKVTITSAGSDGQFGTEDDLK